MANNIARLDLIGPGSLAFKRILNANWYAIDGMCISERIYAVTSLFTTAGRLLAFDTSGNIALAYDDASVNVERKVPFGFAVNSVSGTGNQTVRMMGKIDTATIVGSPSIGDVLYLSGTSPGALDAAPGPNAVACGIFTGSGTALFRPRILVAS